MKSSRNAFPNLAADLFGISNLNFYFRAEIDGAAFRSSDSFAIRLACRTVSSGEFKLFRSHVLQEFHFENSKRLIDR